MPRQRERRFRSRAEIESILKDYSRSGRSQRDFARTRGISLSSLGYWLWKARWREGREVGRVEASRIVPVKVVRRPPEGSKAFLEVVLRGDRLVRVYPGFDPDTLAQVLAVVEAGC